MFLSPILVIGASKKDIPIIKNGLFEYRVLLIPTISEAVSFLAASPDISLMILDIDTLESSGIDFLRGITSNSRFQSIPILSITKADQSDKESEALRLGSDICMYKPLQENRLRAQVELLLDRKIMYEVVAEGERSRQVLLTHLPGMAYRCDYDPQWTMQFVSAGCLELTGYPAEDLLHNNKLSFNDVIALEYRDILQREWEKSLSHNTPFKREYEIVTCEGRRKWVLEMGQGVKNTAGDIEALEGIILDISERKKVESELAYLYEHDSWTGLFNRRYFEQLLEKDLSSPIDTKRAIVSVNLSSIYVLNMRYGFHYSLDIIKQAALALGRHCSDTIQLFNTYENRFVFYVTDYLDRSSLTTFCSAVSRTLESVLAIERVGWGLGVIEVSGGDTISIEQLLRNLLIASERSLSNFGEGLEICFFDEALKSQVEREQQITEELYQIADGKDPYRLFLEFQPILDLKTNKISGFEALARLRSTALGLVSPLDFIPIAEKTKLIIPLGKLIMLQACQFLRKLHFSGFHEISISINISPVQLLEKTFLASISEVIEMTGIDAHYISLEITESVVAFNFQEANGILKQIKEMGIQIALDDFGTGYSSLSRERELHINCIKIDKSFIDKLLHLQPSEAITGDIISMAHKMGHYTVAEGVEHKRQRAYLEHFGCDRIQGFLISEPVEERLAIELLHIHNR